MSNYFFFAEEMIAFENHIARFYETLLKTCYNDTRTGALTCLFTFF